VSSWRVLCCAMHVSKSKQGLREVDHRLGEHVTSREREGIYLSTLAGGGLPLHQLSLICTGCNNTVYAEMVVEMVVAALQCIISSLS
jgi:hypothetical protein